MIIGIASLIMMLFGGGSLDVFYIDKIEEGIKKEVVDKDRKKELQGGLQEYTKTIKEFNKVRKNQIKDLKKKNLDRSTSEEWYIEFYESRLQERIDLQKTFIRQRITLQKKINDEEWDAIMKTASDQTTKLAEKEQRNDGKKKDENAFRVQERAIVDNVADQERRMIILKALAIYEALYNQIHDSYETVNVNESLFLAEKDASKEKMLILAGILNDQRVSLYKGFTVFLIVMQNNATDEEWKPIMSAFNKMLE
jgi:hypothetical protein